MGSSMAKIVGLNKVFHLRLKHKKESSHLRNMLTAD